uniref:Ribonuclease H protein At1g65750 family n=1 Tax=Cajanus cajan TaxID=3821 RepID=A0A151UFK2_CAJCA
MQEEEDTIHVLRDCEFAGEVWNKITGGAITRRSRNRDIQCWITSNLVRNEFSPSHGIRQGDPISPYLFVLCMERLFQLITSTVESQQWRPIKLSRDGPLLSHLAFADDLILFAEATSDQVEVIQSCLDQLCGSSGQKSVFLPRSVCDEVDRLCRSFLWGESNNQRRYHAIGWSTVCQPKEHGGLGLRSMRNVNTAYMMKNCWSLITEPHKLWVQVVRSKYNCLDKIIPCVTKRRKMSNLWQGICATWSLVTPHIHWRVKNGQTIRFWYDV